MKNSFCQLPQFCLREGWQWSSFFFNCHGFKPVAIKEKKRERTARPEVFTEGHAQNNLHQIVSN